MLAISKPIMKVPSITISFLPRHRACYAPEIVYATGQGRCNLAQPCLLEEGSLQVLVGNYATMRLGTKKEERFLIFPF